MEKTTDELFFNYLKDILFKPEEADLDMEQVPEEWKKFAQGMQFLEQCVKEQNLLGSALANGKLDVPTPSPDNVVAAPLASVQAALKHLTWKMQKVAEGDFEQKIDFMGDFEQVFNGMVHLLEQQRSALISERDKVIRRNKELEQIQKLFLTLTSNLNEWVIVLDIDTGEEYFASKGLKTLWTQNKKLADFMRESFALYTDEAGIGTETWEMEFSQSEKENNYYYVVTYHLTWQDRPALVHVIENITYQKKKDQDFHKLVFEDNLTGLYNRRYGMEEMNRMAQENRSFCLGFVDLDDLKFCNDEFGHEEGDRYIQQVATLLKNIPGEKTICRIGGDEFLILKEDISEKEMNQLLQEKRKKLLEYKPKGGTAIFTRSFSYGVAQVPADGTKTAKEALGEADYKMYQLKFLYKSQKKQKYGFPEPAEGNGHSGRRSST